MDLLPAKWRAQETDIKTSKTSKDLETMPLEELVGILTIYEHVLQNDANNGSKRKNIVFNISHKGKKKCTNQSL